MLIRDDIMHCQRLVSWNERARPQEARIRALDFPRDEGRWKHTDNFMSWTFREAKMIWIDEEENKGQ